MVRETASTGRIASSAMWRIAETGGTEAIAFLVFTVLANTLAPENFGAVALASSFMSLLQAALYHGFTEALIQRPTTNDDHYRAVLAVNMLAGGFLAAAAIAYAWPLGYVLGRKEFPLIFAALAPSLILRGMCSPLLAALRRSMNFKPIAIGTLLSVSLSGLLGISLARWGAGYWALVAQQWSVELIIFTVLAISSPIKPWQARFNQRALRELLPVAMPVMRAQLLSIGARRLDAVALGTFLSNREVGIYFLVYRLVFAAQMVTQQGLGEIVMVVLSSLHGDRERYRSGLIRAMRITTCISCLAFGLLSVAGPWLVPIVFGAKWHDAAVPLQVLGGLSAAGAVVSTTGVVLVADGRASLFSRLAIGAALLQLGAAFVAARWGVVAVAWSVGISQVLALIPATALIRRLYALSRASLSSALLSIVVLYAAGLCISELVRRTNPVLGGQVFASVAFVMIMGGGSLYFLRREYAGLR